MRMRCVLVSLTRGIKTSVRHKRQVSRYVADFGRDLNTSRATATEIFRDLEAMDKFLDLYGRVNGLVSPEERHANKEESKRRWEEEKEASIMRWDWCGFGGGGVECFLQPTTRCVL